MRLSPLKSLLTVVLTASVTLVHPVSGQVCNQGLYKDFLILSNYPPAERYCTAHFPLPATTITVTVTPGAKHRRSVAKTTTASSIKPTTSTSKSTSTSSQTTSSDAMLDALVDSATRKGGGFISTLCSCIEKKQTTTVTATAAAPQCTAGQLQGQIAQCFYYISCDQTFVADSGLTPFYTTETSIVGCVNQCDGDFGQPAGQYNLCRGFNYYTTLTTNNCVFFQEINRGVAFYHYDFSTPGVITGINTMNGVCQGL